MRMIIVLISVVNLAPAGSRISLERPRPRLNGVSGVTVPVMQVRVVRMLMREAAVLVFMRVGLRSVPRKIVLVLMMRVVHVGVRVRERLVPVLMSMALGQVEGHAGGHQQGRQPKARRRRLTQDVHYDRRTEKGGGREVGACTGRS